MNIRADAQRKLRRFAVQNLMYYIAGGMLVVFLFDLLIPRVNLSLLLSLDRDLIFGGQVWRLVTFLFVPPTYSILWILFSLYFFAIIGNALENQWGAYRFNVFYLIGVVANIVSALITGYGFNTYLNLSLFLAFAALYPNFEVMVFFLLPVKVKFLALLDVALFLWEFIVGSWPIRSAILFSLLNIALFFGRDLLRHAKIQMGFRKTRRNFRNNMYR